MTMLDDQTDKEELFDFLGAINKVELQALAERLNDSEGLNISSNSTKAEIVEALRDVDNESLCQEIQTTLPYRCEYDDEDEYSDDGDYFDDDYEDDDNYDDEED